MTNAEHLANVIDLSLIGEIDDNLFNELAKDIDTGLSEKEIKDIHKECKSKTNHLYRGSNIDFITKIVLKRLK